MKFANAGQFVYKNRMSFRATLKEIPATVKLAAPIALGMLSHMILQLTDTLMLGHYGTHELAAASLANGFVIIILLAGFGFGQAVSALSSQALGEKDERIALGIYHLSSIATLVYGVLAVIFIAAILPLFDHLGQDPRVAALAKPFALLITLSFIPGLLFQTARNYYETLKRPWITFAYMALVVALNIFFNWVFIFGKFGAPALGIVGSGLGTLLARLVMAAIFFIHAHMPGQPLCQRERVKIRNIPFNMLPKILAIAGNTSLQAIATNLAYLLGSLWVGMAGFAGLAGQRIVGTMDATLYMLPLGISYALSARIGRAKGEDNFVLARTIYRGGFWITVVFCGAASLLMFIFRRPLVGAFTTDPPTIAIAVNLAMISCVFRVFDGLDCVTIASLRALGDIVVPSIIYLGLYWLLAMPLGYYLAFVRRMGAAGVWWGYTAAIVLMGAFMVARFWRVAWRRSGAKAEAG